MKQPISIALERQITRADGTVEPKATVAYWHRNPVRRFITRRRLGIKGKVSFGAHSRPSS